MNEPTRARVFGAALTLCLTAAFAMVAGAQAQPAAAIPPGPAPNLRVQKSCTDAPNLGLNVVQCLVDVDNFLGTANANGPINVVDNPTSSPAGATFAGMGPYSSFQCSTPAGGLPTAINCSFPTSFTFGNQPGYGAPAILKFVVPPGTTLRNCATATQTQNAATRPDSNAANNTNICVSFTRGPGPTGGSVTVTKSCTPGANHSFTCAVTVTNHTATAIPAGTQVSETLTGAPAGTTELGHSNLTCPFPTTYTAPLACTTVSPIAPNGGTATFNFAFRTPAAARIRNCAAIRAAIGPVQGCTDINVP
jgi:hypothetical protein